MYSDREIEQLIPRLDNIFEEGVSPVWIAKYKGQPIKLHNGKETFRTEKGVKLSLANHLKRSARLHQHIADIRNDTKLGWWAAKQDYNPKLGKLLIARGTITIERIR